MLSHSLFLGHLARSPPGFGRSLFGGGSRSFFRGLLFGRLLYGLFYFTWLRLWQIERRLVLNRLHGLRLR